MSDEAGRESHFPAAFQEQQLDIQREDLALRREHLEFQKHQSELAYKQAGQSLNANERYLMENLKYGEIQNKRNSWFSAISLSIIAILIAFLGYIGELSIVTNVIMILSAIGGVAVGTRLQSHSKNPTNRSISRLDDSSIN